MRRYSLIAAIATLSVVFAAPAFAANIASVLATPPQHDNFKIINVATLSKLIANPKSHVHIFDADPPDVRSSEGTIPGARLLSSSDKFDVARELPPDHKAKLVFYCHNPH